MAQQTAMKSLVELLKVKDVYKEPMPYILEIIEEVYLPMEKEQIITNYLDGIMHPLDMEATKQAEQYYNETYKN